MKYFLFLALFAVNNLFPQTLPDRNLDSLLQAGINFVTSQKYDNAESVFTALGKAYPDLPLGNLYLAATEILRSSDYGFPLNEKRIEYLLKISLDKAESNLNKDEDNLWNNYYIGLVKGFEAYYYGISGGMISALSSGLKAVTYFEKCISIDSDFSDAYIALGTYKYWKSEKTEFLNWLPFVPDERKTGINFLRKGVFGKSKNSLLGFNSLIWIYIREKNFDEALKIAGEGLNQYPASRMLKMSMARIYENSDLNKANNLYREIMASYEKEKKLTNFRRVILLHKLAQNHYRMGDNEKALSLCNEIMAIKNFTEYESEKLKNRLKRVNELRNELR